MKDQPIQIDKEKFINLKNIYPVMGKSNSRLADIGDIGRLCYETPNKPFHTNVNYNGTTHRCDVEFDKEGRRIIFTTKFTPKEYHVEGVLFSGCDETRFGLDLACRVMDKSSLSLSYFDDYMTYGRSIDVAKREQIPKELKSFVEDVIRTAAE